LADKSGLPAEALAKADYPDQLNLFGGTKEKNMFFVYLLRSHKNKKHYIGSTSKLPNKRLNEHNLGSNKWTRNNKPFDLLYYESYYYKKDAIHRENFLKTGVGRKLVKLIVKYY